MEKQVKQTQTRRFNVFKLILHADFFKSFRELSVILLMFFSFAFIQTSRTDPFEVSNLSSLQRDALNGVSYVSSPQQIVSYFEKLHGYMFSSCSGSPDTCLVNGDTLLLLSASKMFFPPLSLQPCAYPILNRSRQCTLPTLDKYGCNEAVNTLNSSFGIPLSRMTIEVPNFLWNPTPVVWIYMLGENASDAKPLEQACAQAILAYNPLVRANYFLIDEKNGLLYLYEIFFESVSDTPTRTINSVIYYKARFYRSALLGVHAFWHYVHFTAGIWSTRKLFKLYKENNVLNKMECKLKLTFSPRSFLRNYLGYFWNIVDIVDTFLFFVWFVLTVLDMSSLQSLAKFYSDYKNVGTTSEVSFWSTFVFVRFVSFTTWSAIALYVGAAHFLILGLRVLKLLRFHPGMHVFLHSLRVCSSMFINSLFLLLFVNFWIAIVAFVWLGQIGNHSDFSSIGWTLNSIYRMAFGMFDYSTFLFGPLAQGNSDYAKVGQTGALAVELKLFLFWISIFFCTIIMQNFFLAIITDAFSSCREAFDNRRDKFSDSFFVSFCWWLYHEFHVLLRQRFRMKNSFIEHQGALLTSSPIQLLAFICYDWRYDRVFDEEGCADRLHAVIGYFNEDNPLMSNLVDITSMSCDEMVFVLRNLCSLHGIQFDETELKSISTSLLEIYDEGSRKVNVDEIQKLESISYDEPSAPPLISEVTNVDKMQKLESVIYNQAPAPLNPSIRGVESINA